MTNEIECRRRKVSRFNMKIPHLLFLVFLLQGNTTTIEAGPRSFFSSSSSESRKLPKVKEQLTFKHYLPLLKVYGDVIKTKCEVYEVVQKCYDFAADYEELNDFILAISNVVFTKNKEEIFTVLPEDVKRGPNIGRILMRSSSDKQKSIILRFVQLVSSLNESKVENIIAPLITKTREFLSDEHNFPNLNDSSNAARKCCFKSLDLIESNATFFQMYFDGLVTFKKCMPNTGVLFMGGICDVVGRKFNEEPDEKTKKIKSHVDELDFVIPDSFHN